jgi:acetylornithine deacetylase/succinyl-diaminopimelate desuccinylase-like protein
MATRVIEILEQYQARLLESSRGIAFFDDHPNPMPITFGKLNAGNWPATAPAHAVIEGVLGFLPNKTRFQIMQEMREAIREAGDPWLKENFTLEFMYRHDAQVLAPTHPLVSELQVACREAGSGGDVAAITASSDSWYYGNQLEIPTLVFGPGSLSVAHSNHEQVRMDEVCRAAVILVRFCERWCGKA